MDTPNNDATIMAWVLASVGACGVVLTTAIRMLWTRTNSAGDADRQRIKELESAAAEQAKTTLEQIAALQEFVRTTLINMCQEQSNTISECSRQLKKAEAREAAYHTIIEDLKRQNP